MASAVTFNITILIDCIAKFTFETHWAKSDKKIGKAFRGWDDGKIR